MLSLLMAVYWAADKTPIYRDSSGPEQTAGWTLLLFGIWAAWDWWTDMKAA